MNGNRSALLCIYKNLSVTLLAATEGAGEKKRSKGLVFQ